MSSFIYLRDGEGIEAFEPGLPDTLLGDEPFKFWADTQKIMDRANQTTPMVPVHAVLQAITKHIRGLLDRTVLEGPLLTAFLSDADRAPMNAYFDDGQTAPQTSVDRAGTYPRAQSAARFNPGPLPVMMPPHVAPDTGYGRGAARAS
jgi:hypothetical protein